MRTHKRTRRAGTLRVFTLINKMPLFKSWHSIQGDFRGFVGLLPVNPLADVITNHTRCDRNYEVYYVFHEFHLLPDGRSRHLKYTMGISKNLPFCFSVKSKRAMCGASPHTPTSKNIVFRGSHMILSATSDAKR